MSADDHTRLDLVYAHGKSSATMSNQQRRTSGTQMKEKLPFSFGYVSILRLPSLEPSPLTWKMILRATATAVCRALVVFVYLSAV